MLPVLLGAGAGVLVVGAMMVLLCSVHDPHMKRLSAQATVLAVQTLVLAVTAGFVVWYAYAAHRQATNSEWTAGIQLLSRSVLFVTDPIKTVGQYKNKKDCSDLTEVLRIDDSPITDDWLMIEITNEGDKKAMNIKAWASWRPGFDNVDATPSDRMRPLCKCEDFDGKEKNVWTEWRLPPGQSRLFYFRPPSCPELTDPKCGRTLRLRWYDVAYPRWTHDITIFKKDCTWHTGWEAGPDLDDPRIYRPVLDTTQKE